ncbi:1793_t:CDS:2, partial [Funneliformis geosporum]
MADWSDAQTRILIDERAKYFEEFRSHFWEKPEDSFDRIRNMNISNRRRGRGIVSPAPSIDVVEQ